MLFTKIFELFSRIPKFLYLHFNFQAQRVVRQGIKQVPYLDHLSANMLTSFRIIIALVICVILTRTNWQESQILYIILGLNIVAYATDLFDGALATVKDERSPLGAWLDNIADKILLVPNLYIAYYLLDKFVIVFAILLIDIALIILRIIAHSQKIHVEANYFGKFKVSLQGIAFCLIETNFSPLLITNKIILGASLLFGALSLIFHVLSHAKTFLQSWRGK